MKPFDTYFTEKEEKKIFRTLKSRSGIQARRDLAWMQLARHSAVRVCVLAGLTVGDAEKALKTERFRIRPEINKRKKQQDLFCNKAIHKALSDLLKIHKKMSCEEDWPEIPKDERPLILSRNHQGLSIRTFQDRVAVWCSEAGIVEGSPHWWRHTWAKRQVATSDDVAKTMLRVQLWLGHSDPKSTTIYTKPDKEDMAEFAREAR